MRLLTVTHFFESHGGGIERVAGQLNRRLTAAGHDTVWAAADEPQLPGAEVAGAVPMPCANLVERLTGLPMPIPGPTALRRLAAAVRGSDAVIVHDALYCSSIAALVLARHYRKPVILVQHIAGIPFANPVLKRVMALANRLVTRPMLRAADQVVFISDTTRHAFATARTRTAPILLFNGVDAAVFHRTDAEERAATRVTLGIDDDRRTCLFVGRFVEKKGLAIVRRLAEARPDWLILVAGRGPIDPDAWALPNIRVLRDRAGPTLASLYRTADALVLPSVGEGYPLVVQEAMACGLPVVCGEETSRADPGARRWLYPIDVDLAEPAHSVEQLIAALDTVHDTDRAAMSAYAIHTYDWSAMAARIAEVAADQSGNATRRHRAKRAASSSLA